MADTIQVTHTTGVTLYVMIRDEDGDVYNGTAFETYSAANWLDYDYPLTEQTSSGVYTRAFPALATGDYNVTIYKQDGGSPVAGDLVVGLVLVPWDGTAIVSLEDCSDTSAAAAILSNPSNKLLTDGSGEVTASNTTAIATAVWASGTRTLSSFGTLVADVATAVWGAGTRLLTAFSFDTNNATLEGRLTSGRASNLDNLDVASSTLGTAANLALVKTATDKMEDTLELDGAEYRFTTNALEQGPDSVGDSTLAKQDEIIADIAALENASVASITAGILAGTVDGSIDVQTALKTIFASQHGKMVRTATDPLTFQLYADDDTTVLFTWTIPTTGASRTVT